MLRISARWLIAAHKFAEAAAAKVAIELRRWVGSRGEETRCVAARTLRRLRERDHHEADLRQVLNHLDGAPFLRLATEDDEVRVGMIDSDEAEWSSYADEARRMQALVVLQSGFELPVRFISWARRYPAGFSRLWAAAARSLETLPRWRSPSSQSCSSLCASVGMPLSP